MKITGKHTIKGKDWSFGNFILRAGDKVEVIEYNPRKNSAKIRELDYGMEVEIPANVLLDHLELS